MSEEPARKKQKLVPDVKQGADTLLPVSMMTQFSAQFAWLGLEMGFSG